MLDSQEMKARTMREDPVSILKAKHQDPTQTTALNQEEEDKLDVGLWVVGQRQVNQDDGRKRPVGS